MNKHLQTVKERLDSEVAKRNSLDELHLSRPDPVMAAREYAEESSALICALFGYGRAESIIKFLYSLDLSLLESSEKEIEKAL
ncbi:MAG: TIGR02757 family protein, partial [Thiovulaceae bacterium]|nr:TIGR02757 family protein [Sulfurimonadaceae bacterium]